MKTTELLRDALIVAGAALIVAGLWQIWRPLGLMALGLLLVVLPIVWELDAARRKAAGEDARPIHPVRTL